MSNSKPLSRTFLKKNTAPPSFFTKPKEEVKTQPKILKTLSETIVEEPVQEFHVEEKKIEEPKKIEVPKKEEEKKKKVKKEENITKENKSKTLNISSSLVEESTVEFKEEKPIVEPLPSLQGLLSGSLQVNNLLLTNPPQNDILSKSCIIEEPPKIVKILKEKEQHVEGEEEEKKRKLESMPEEYLESISYDELLSELKSQGKKEHERETFCEGFFIASFPTKGGEIIENSESFPAVCGHQECSILPAMKPEIITRYPLEDTKNLELNNLAATICFPTGIKTCYSENNPCMVKDYVTPITNQKGERYYMMTYHFYLKVMNDFYIKLYENYPLKHHLMKFSENYSKYEEIEQKEKEIEKELELCTEFGFREYVYVPYCICLISKYPYVIEMKKCLQSIYTLIVNRVTGPELNGLIMHIIKSIPIPERNTRIRFYVPYFSQGIDILCPKIQDMSIMNINIADLLKYFRIDNIVLIFRLILFEKKILFIDDDYSHLSNVTDSFISLLYPFKWIHTYIPIMSNQMLKYLETFLPFLNGINNSLMPLVKEQFENNEVEDSEEIYIIYINIDKVRLGSSLTGKEGSNKKYKYFEEHIPALPYSNEKELKYKLKIIKNEIETYQKNIAKKDQKTIRQDMSLFDFKIRKAFIEMFVEMFHDYYKYMTFLDEDVIFNKNLFIETIPEGDKNFYDEFLDTQLFQQFSQNIIKDELNYFKTLAVRYDPNKKDKDKNEDLFNPNSTDNIDNLENEKRYIASPEYLNIKEKDKQIIEKQIASSYKMNQKVDEDGIILSSHRILSNINKIKDENFTVNKCRIFITPESRKTKEELKEENKTEEEVKLNKIFETLKKLKLIGKTKAGEGGGSSNRATLRATVKNSVGSSSSDLTDREKDEIKEIIKDFTMKIFKSEEIDTEDVNLKKDLQNAMNTPFGREFFVGILAKNVTNVILLKEKSFNLLGTLIYNSLIFVLQLEENDRVLKECAILINSTKFFGHDVKGNTVDLWNDYKTRIQGFPKINQINFWEKWFDVEISRKEDKSDDVKEAIILNICDLMFELEINKSLVKKAAQGIINKVFGKNSEQGKKSFKLVVEKIVNAKYISRAK